MKETIGQILMQIRGAWRFRWYALATAWSIAVIGWIAIVLTPNMYVANATVYVDTDSVLKPLLNGLAVSPDMQGRVRMMSRLIMGRPQLEKVALETGLARRAHGSVQLSELMDSMSKRVTLDGSGDYYSLHYADRDPAMAQRVVQALLDAFVGDTLGIKSADNGSAQQFLQTQIQDYAARLRDSENQLADFKRRHIGMMPGETGDYFTRLQTASAKLDDLQSKLRLAGEQRTALEQQLQGEEPTFGLFSSGSSAQDGGNPKIAALDSQIANYRGQLAQLLLRYTDKFPRVIQMKDAIAQLEAQKAALAKAPKSRSASGPAVPRNPSMAAAFSLDLNPVYQDLRLDLARTKLGIGGLQEQIGEEQHTIGDLRARVNTMPTIQAQLTQLTRNYQVTNTQYQQLLQRLDSARLSAQAEASNDQVKFRTVDPPRLPHQPSSPNRPRLMTLILTLALGAAIALAILLNELKPVFLSRAMITAVTGLPVLGSISYVEAGPERPLLRREPVRILIGGAALLVAYVLALGLAGPVSRIAQRLLG